jgi:ubiquinol-cytochrome c reductase cytochrome c1 subunit
MARRHLLALVLALAPMSAFAAEAEHPPEQPWSFNGPFGTFDQESVQRGFQVYKEVCAACHSMDFLTYRNLGEPGGPFVAHGKYNVQAAQWEDVALGPPHHGGRMIPANDNPYVRAIAAEYEITEIDPSTGQETSRPALPADTFKNPYSNPFEAAATHGVAPPDLSVITKARDGGADYIHALMTGYGEHPHGEEPPAANLSYNRYFPGGWISMPPQLTPDRVSYADGTPATPDQMARDVATFLAWASEPKQEERKKMGFVVIAFLIILSGLLYAAYRQVWRDVKH